MSVFETLVLGFKVASTLFILGGFVVVTAWAIIDQDWS